MRDIIEFFEDHKSSTYFLIKNMAAIKKSLTENWNPKLSEQDRYVVILNQFLDSTNSSLVIYSLINGLSTGKIRVSDLDKNLRGRVAQDFDTLSRRVYTISGLMPDNNLQRDIDSIVSKINVITKRMENMY